MSKVKLVAIGAAEQVCLPSIVVWLIAAACLGRSAVSLRPSSRQTAKPISAGWHGAGSVSAPPELPPFAHSVPFESGRCFPLRGECRSFNFNIRRYLSNLRR